MDKWSDYKATLDFLYHKLPMFERIGPKAFKKDLTNIRRLCAVLGNPQEKFRSIHIAGTNGKGSVSHMLNSVLTEAGYKTGLYISPHYKDYRERIRVNGTFISRQFIIAFVRRIKPHIDVIKPSFFEITVAMAFEYFASKKIDIAVIETGLGGRLDSTNVITPLLSIITNIGYDHQNMLGNTLKEIAGEKAGIIKPSVPVLIGEYQREVYPVFKEKARKTFSQMICASKQGKVMTQATTFRYVYRSKEKKYTKLDMPFHGSYQEKNINTVICAVQWLQHLGKLDVKQAALERGLKNIDKNSPLTGRWQILDTRPLVIADGAHNIDGIKYVIKQLINYKAKKIHIVFGTVKDKDVIPVLKLMPKEAMYYFVNADLPRAMDDNELLLKASALGLSGIACGTVKKGYQTARFASGKSDMILITGSIFVVGEVVK
jgi:dihydrofolate synthase/folylpolyglutamate synthase